MQFIYVIDIYHAMTCSGQEVLCINCSFIRLFKKNSVTLLSMCKIHLRNILVALRYMKCIEILWIAECHYNMIAIEWDIHGGFRLFGGKRKKNRLLYCLWAINVGSSFWISASSFKLKIFFMLLVIYKFYISYTVMKLKFTYHFFLLVWTAQRWF